MLEIPGCAQKGKKVYAIALMLSLSALILVACGQIQALTTPMRTPLSPPPVQAAAPLKWTEGTLPPNLGLSVNALSALALSQSDGAVAYSCEIPANAAVTGALIWVTRDRAVTWNAAGRVFPGETLTGCNVVVDSINPNTAVVITYHAVNDGCMACYNGVYKRFVTINGGKTWSAIAGVDDLIQRLATYRGLTYALFSPHPADLAALKTEFVVSKDRMRTWIPADRGLVANTNDPYNSRNVTAFWLNSATGSILAQTQTNFIFSTQFDESDDGGVSWRRITTPQADNFYVAPAIGSDWRICGDHTSSGTGIPGPINLLTCTFDSGRTWVGEGSPSDNAVYGLAADGSALIIAGGDVERLAPRALAPDELGPLPNRLTAALDYSGGVSDGVIWLYAMTNTGGLASVYSARYE